MAAFVLPRCFHRATLVLTAFTLLAAGIALAAFATGWNRPGPARVQFHRRLAPAPELLALSLGISVYNSGFIAENVRASTGAIGQGQRDAARAVGLPPGRTMRLVIFPQALQTLGAVIAYPEVLQVFARTVLNQSGQAVGS